MGANKMTNQDKVAAYAMRLEGASLQECADRFGVTRECIRQITPPVQARARSRGKCFEDCAFPNLAKWLCENRYSYNSFAKLACISPVSMKKALNGATSVTKRVIDRILEVTGMSYEVAFAKKIKYAPLIYRRKTICPNE